MKMNFRWYGENFDPIPLDYIRQIPGMEGVVCTLMEIPVGEKWPMAKIEAMQKKVSLHNLKMDVIESVNVHENIKLGLPDRDYYIDNYIKTIENLAQVGVKVICYNFMPVFDWTRSDLAYELEDHSNVLCYDSSVIDRISNPQKIAEQIQANSNGYSLPGWEPERLEDLKRLFEAYNQVDHEALFQNLIYFLQKIMPVCEACNVKMAIHPDDPPWDIFGLPRIVNNQENLDKIITAVDSPCNGITLCSGSLGADEKNQIPEMIRYFGKKKKIFFAHVRNIKIVRPGFFHESSHLSSDGTLDLYEIMKAYFDVGFDGYIRPDHGRMIWGEEGRAGYGLYDRALGVTYLNGLIEAIAKENQY